ncbi:hypothetical protein BU24DRAFT_417254 [Aaosphaeria arxii CBS 175.79]|uniref:Uncharacterized protein n=1 Tax=Aaosphaeria arxii CBS 175.79 TaxID=1450172 RepID=A0A6A5Y8S2_9PLEO|nr:uncharacterized protein BU24DRAFT_417254 [Aaosphaeria arxii CBS 175.79]KAF2021623.1 hypothetical protein BU24DRAFT_417254 [Aaosphaeria arxii CBS 175.79]
MWACGAGQYSFDRLRRPVEEKRKKKRKKKLKREEKTKRGAMKLANGYETSGGKRWTQQRLVGEAVAGWRFGRRRADACARGSSNRNEPRLGWSQLVEGRWGLFFFSFLFFSPADQDEGWRSEDHSVVCRRLDGWMMDEQQREGKGLGWHDGAMFGSDLRWNLRQEIAMIFFHDSEPRWNRETVGERSRAVQQLGRVGK